MRWRGVSVRIMVLLLLGTSRTYAVRPIPLEKRLSAEIIQYLTGPEDRPMRMPTDVAADSKGRILVADGVNNRIVRFGAQGEFDKNISEPNGLELNRPLGLTVDAFDRIWIADTGNHRLVVLEADEQTCKVIDLPQELPGSAAVHPSEPTDVSITADDRRCYVVDNDNHRLLIRDNQGGGWTAMGRPGRAIGNFQWPFMVCIGSEGYVFVTEVVGSRIQRISPAGRWSGQLGSWGVELGQVYRPKGITADGRGRIYVSDSTLKVIQVFEPWGRVEGVLCAQDGQPLRFEHPMGICFDREGYLYVIELTADRVAKVLVSGSSTLPRENLNHPKDESCNR